MRPFESEKEVEPTVPYFDRLSMTPCHPELVEGGHGYTRDSGVTSHRLACSGKFALSKELIKGL